MNSYLFTALTTVSQVRPNPGRYGPSESFQTWDACASLIVLDANPDEALKRFEAWLHTQPEGQNPADIRIRKIAAAQFVDQLLTESANAPLDWPEIWKQWESQLEAGHDDDFEQGYWVDVDPIVRPGQLSVDFHALQAGLPEDIRAGLNWSVDKQFLFLLTVFTPPPPPPDLAAEPEMDDPSFEELPDESSAASDALESQRLLALFPQGADKETAALIRARNSVVAAWLWRRYAADTRVAANQIRIDPCCGVMGLEQGPNE